MVNEMTTVAAAIAAAEKELVMRERAAAHLSGIPARQNTSSINYLYDRLTDLHIRRVEGRP
jgi:hypothetical protein